MKNTPNILQFICPAGMYGAEMWILALARNLTKRGCQSVLAVSYESKDQNLELCNRYKHLKLPAYKLKMTGRFDPLIIFKLAKLIKEKKIDIIHTHGYKSDILGLMAAKKAGIKALSTPHGFENANDIKLQFFSKVGCHALKFFDMVAPLSDDLFSDIERIGVNHKKIRLILNGVDLDEIREAVNKTYNTPGNSKKSIKKIGYVGQISSRKNVVDLIQCFDLLYKTHKNVQLVIVGDGPMKKKLEVLASGLPCSKLISFLGYRKNRLEIMKSLDLFCMTSSLEGIPRCMMEAMAIGIPVAAYGIPGVDKLIINGKTGLSVKFGDIKGLKNSIEQLLFDEKFSKMIAEKGQNHIIKHFSASRMADEYIKLYKELMI